MEAHETAAWVATAILAALGIFQLLLAAGLPLGHAAWGGEHRVLPPKLRWNSLAAVPILAAAAWMVLARAGLAAPGADAPLVRIIVWVFAAYFTLNTVMNMLSKSTPERVIMTPASSALVVCFVTVAMA